MSLINFFLVVEPGYLGTICYAKYVDFYCAMRPSKVLQLSLVPGEFAYHIGYSTNLQSALDPLE